jgi:hypothetical protein
VQAAVAVEKGTNGVIFAKLCAIVERRITNLQPHFPREVPRKEFSNTTDFLDNRDGFVGPGAVSDCEQYWSGLLRDQFDLESAQLFLVAAILSEA